jgi:exopolysaccharide biosynthesis predicted pyruvyltransferase EpsI
MTHDPFIDLLERFKDRTFFLSAAAGNSGDVLLQTGLLIYLHNNNFLLTDKIEDADVVLTHGGSNINDIWKAGISLLVENLNKYPDKIFVVAPHTFTFYETNFAAILQEYQQDIHLFAREEYSFAYLESIKRNDSVSIYLSDDTAFLLVGTSYLQKLKAECTNSYVLHAMRTDRESAIISLDLDRVPQNVFEKVRLIIIQFQLRRYLKQVTSKQPRRHPVILQDISYLLYDEFIDKVQHASQVHTDRLHVGILGALLGKPVFLYSTKYSKIKGVYHQSLQAYKHVTPMFD